MENGFVGVDAHEGRAQTPELLCQIKLTTFNTRVTEN